MMSDLNIMLVNIYNTVDNFAITDSYDIIKARSLVALISSLMSPGIITIVTKHSAFQRNALPEIKYFNLTYKEIIIYKLLLAL